MGISASSSAPVALAAVVDLPSLLLSVLVLGVLAATAVAFYGATRREPRSRVVTALAQGEFLEAFELGPADPDSIPATAVEDLLAAAVAARHLAELDRAVSWLDAVVRRDSKNGEGWLEFGLALAYSGEFKRADKALARAAGLSPQLGEAVLLHRAWVALRSGLRQDALRRFEEIEAPIENKLETDLGSGEPAFADWFFQASELWRASGRADRADWSLAQAQHSAPQSLLGRNGLLAPVGSIDFELS